MKNWWVAILLLLFCPAALACSIPLDGKIYTESQDFCNKKYYLPNGIIIGADNIVIDCQGGILQGDFYNTGVFAKDRKGFEIRNCHIMNYNYGIKFKNVTKAEVHDNNLLRNHIGIRLEEASQNHFYENRDVSISRMLQDIYSEDNHVRYTNKNIEGDFCRHNSCNENTPEKNAINLQRSYLSTVLHKAIMRWISMDLQAQ